MIVGDVRANDEKILAGLARVITLLEDLFILEASRIGVKKKPLRQLLRIDKRRIGRIAKHVPSEREARPAADRRY
jgi:hypothetical protein